MCIRDRLYSITFVFASILSPLTSVLEANERFDVSSVVAVIGQVISILLGMLLLWLGYGFLGLLCVGFVAMFVQIMVTLRAMHIYKLHHLPFRFAPGTWPTLIRASLPFGLTTLALTLNFRKLDGTMPHIVSFLVCRFRWRFFNCHDAFDCQ